MSSIPSSNESADWKSRQSQTAFLSDIPTDDSSSVVDTESAILTESYSSYTDLLGDSFYTATEDHETSFEDQPRTQQKQRPSGGCYHNELFTEACAEPLYESADISVFYAYLLIFQFAVRHSLSTKSFGELICLLAALLPAGAKLPSSVFALKSFFVKLFPESQPQLQYYCSCCHKLLPNMSQCERYECAGSSVETFISLCLETQLQRIVEGIKVVMYHPLVK